MKLGIRYSISCIKNEQCQRKNDNFQALFQKFSQICKIISNNFENRLLEQIIIDKNTVGNLNKIDIEENIVIFVHILSSFNGKITFIAKIIIKYNKI